MVASCKDDGGDDEDDADHAHCDSDNIDFNDIGSAGVDTDSDCFCIGPSVIRPVRALRGSVCAAGLHL